MARLSSHVLDTIAWLSGCRDSHRSVPGRTTVTPFAATAVTDETAEHRRRCSENWHPVGSLQLVFHAGDYFRSRGLRFPEPRPFSMRSPSRLESRTMAGTIHVPLLLSPYGYRLPRFMTAPASAAAESVVATCREIAKLTDEPGRPTLNFSVSGDEGGACVVGGAHERGLPDRVGLIMWGT